MTIKIKVLTKYKDYKRFVIGQRPTITEHVNHKQIVQYKTKHRTQRERKGGGKGIGKGSKKKRKGKRI